MSGPYHALEAVAAWRSPVGGLVLVVLEFWGPMVVVVVMGADEGIRVKDLVVQEVFAGGDEVLTGSVSADGASIIV